MQNLGVIFYISAKNLISDKIRFLITLSGVGMAVALILLLRGIANGTLIQSATFINNTTADLFVVQEGTNNLYQNAVDTSIMNPLGFSNNFNTTTGSFISGMTSANKDNVVDYQQIMESMRSDLTNSLSVGPDYLNVGSGEPMMIPPYATNM